MVLLLLFHILTSNVPEQFILQFSQMSLYRILFHSIEAQPLIKRTEIVSSIVLQRGKFLYTFSYLKSDISPCILLAVSCEKPAYHSAQSSHLWPLPPQKWPSIAASRDAILNLANILFYIRRRLNVLSVPFALSKRNLKLELCFSKSYLKEYITLCFFFQRDISTKCECYTVFYAFMQWPTWFV